MTEQSQSVKAPTVEITVQIVGQDPAIPIYHIEVFSQRGTWNETFSSRPELEAFIRGLRAGCVFSNCYLPDPEIPQVSPLDLVGRSGGSDEGG